MFVMAQRRQIVTSQPKRSAFLQFRENQLNQLIKDKIGRTGMASLYTTIRTLKVRRTLDSFWFRRCTSTNNLKHNSCDHASSTDFFRYFILINEYSYIHKPIYVYTGFHVGL